MHNPEMVSPQALTRRSLEMHRLVVEKIRRDPELFEVARATLTRWRTIVCQSSQPYLIEWESRMADRDACLAFAVEDSEHASDMRQSSPFSVLLSNDERLEFLRTWASQFYIAHR